MAFATADDVSDRLGRELSTGETQSINYLLDAATAVIAQAANQSDAWASSLTPVPNILRVVTVELVCRALANPKQLDSLNEALGQYNYSARFSGSLFLTDAEQRLVARTVNDGSGSVRIPALPEDVYVREAT